MNSKLYLILGLCMLIVHEARVYAGWLGDTDDLPYVKQRKEEREQFAALLKQRGTSEQCTVSFFTEFERLTASGVGGYGADEQDRHDSLKMSLLKECENRFVQNFQSSVKNLGSELEHKLASLARNIKEAQANPVISDSLNFVLTHDTYIVGILSFMGEQGAFSGTTKLSSDEFKVKYEIVFGDTCTNAAKLEPAAEIFRMYWKYRPKVFAQVEESVFELASVSGACVKLNKRTSGATQDYRIYKTLWETRALPGEPRSEQVKSDTQKRVDRLLATKDKCSLGFFKELDVLIDEARQYLRRQGTALLENKRSDTFRECKPIFEQKFMEKVEQLDSEESRKLVALGSVVFGEERIVNDSAKLGKSILEYMKKVDPAIREKELSEVQFDDSYTNMILDPCSSFEAKINPVASILHRFVRLSLMHERNTDRPIILWLRRSTLCQRVVDYQYDARVAYVSMKKPCKLGRFMCGKSHRSAVSI